MPEVREKKLHNLGEKHINSRQIRDSKEFRVWISHLTVEEDCFKAKIHYKKKEQLQKWKFPSLMP